MRSLWIGPPGALREIPDTATEFDRSVALGVQEFSSLAGGVTTTRLATPPRRLSLSWSVLLTEHARWLDALARRAHGPGPLAVLDPASDNLLEAGQSLGRTPRRIQLVGWGTLAERADGVLTITATQANSSQLYYTPPYWLGWPVLPDVPVSFTSHLTRSLEGSVCRLEFWDAGGVFVGSAEPAAPVLTAVPPAEAAFVLPKVDLPALTTPTAVGGALLRLGEPVTAAEPIPVGDGCPAMTITAYADRPRLPHRDLSMTLVEVRRAQS
ncbi:hypothetical protein FHX81_5643 [Saccharothrix saharensis]|uniref:Uncharacterized protein n=1 Tax=Saccharothrix saharensis TaxID=571190 RepID=A0A543JK59_9PSEU|nr:hypothetical protein [Saccharothrix saharensis]TQM83225.1 hypothetical protein FHX81_5643 [Saccharothrix saharensis]